MLTWMLIAAMSGLSAVDGGVVVTVAGDAMVNWDVNCLGAGGWRVCGLCGCCYTRQRTRVVCKGSNVTDVPQDLPRNLTHL